MKKDTSWGKVAGWYDKHLENENTYHAQVVAPNLLRVVDLKPSESLLELGCGQGFFVEKFAALSKHVVGVELGKPLVEIAKKNIPHARFLVGNAEDEKILPGQAFDVITIILALQNMKNLDAVVKNMSRLLKSDGRAVLVLNHPAFRVPKKSSWGIDDTEKIQYRRVDAYMSEQEVTIDMTPGNTVKKITTMTYHRPLQVYAKAFSKHGFAIMKIEEWISHRKSEGPHAKMEDTARKEIPLFMCLVLKKI
jgi:ubiquinone/menaquinone biosynthesis C-methylase UbiE